MVKYLISITMVAMVCGVSLLQINLIIPIKIDDSNVIATKMERVFGVRDPRLADSIQLAARRSGLSPELLLALTWTESNFKQHAISSKGYKGYLQIPYAVYQPDANVLIGAFILVEKLRVTKGDMKDAIILYKGYRRGDPRGKNQANLVLSLSEKIRESDE